MATKTVKMCDLPISIAMKVFEKLNPGKVEVKERNALCTANILVTDVEPKDLTYPEGWYYSKGNFRNKHTSSTGVYEEAKMVKSDGKHWKHQALYCTLDD